MLIKRARPEPSVKAASAPMSRPQSDGIPGLAEAKAALGGYFREFTFAKKRTIGWTDCGHGTPARAVVFDPFAGTGTTLKTAADEGRDAIGVDLVPHMPEQLRLDTTTLP